MSDTSPLADDDDPDESELETTQENHLRSFKEVKGYFIKASDGDIGHVEDLILDDETWALRYVVVDTRNWLPGSKKVQELIELLRAGLIFHARGLITTRAIQYNLDWIWPFRVVKQFTPQDASFIPWKKIRPHHPLAPAGGLHPHQRLFHKPQHCPCLMQSFNFCMMLRSGPCCC